MSGLQREDRTALLSFASRVRLHSPLTNDRPSVLRAFESLEANGTTSLRDAAFAGLVLREADPGRTLLLLFSDGADTSSWLQAPFVLETARRTDVVVYPVALAGRSTIVTRNDPAGFYGPSTQGRVIVPNTTVATREASNRFLDALAGETGGRVVRVGSDRDLKETFVAALAEFRERYMLTYVPAGVPTGGWHPLTVRLKGRSGTVRARRGYFAQ
jgi:VWFA-related protein